MIEGKFDDELVLFRAGFIVAEDRNKQNPPKKFIEEKIQGVNL